jgi:hypothetical protein
LLIGTLRCSGRRMRELMHAQWQVHKDSRNTITVPVLYGRKRWRISRTEWTLEVGEFYDGYGGG